MTLAPCTHSPASGHNQETDRNSTKTPGKPFLAPVVAVWLLAILASPVHANGEPLPLAEYWQRVEATLALVTGLEGQPEDTLRTHLLAAAAEWEQVTQVILPDGAVVPVETGHLVSLLRAVPPDLERIAGALAALLAARDAWPEGTTDPSAPGILERILARPEFQQQPKEPSPLEELWQSIREFLDGLFPDAASDGTVEIQVPYGRLLTIAAVVALAVVLAYTLRGLFGDLVAEATVDTEGQPGDEALDSGAALKQAQAFSTTGDYRTAVRYLYLSTLLLLEERGLLRYDRSLTNREILHSVAHLPRLAATLRAIVDVFDRVWYGFRTLDEATFTRYADQVAELREQSL